MTTAQRSIEHYIHAKDGNRPHLLDQAFTAGATLDMVVHTGSISFPDHVEGRRAIGDVLVSRFNQTFENVYTFCLEAPPADNIETFQCKWLVAMSDKHSGEVRVGCGRYDWRFSSSSSLAEGLVITIEHMKTLPAEELPAVMAWVSHLEYPWSNADAAVGTAPDSTPLEDVVQYISVG
ncbi:hypothetical protein ACJ6X8_14575 [Pseudomonas alvandae]|jgi:hypothetical protein|uniref:hypothetical protein n=1 Tax=Pseudomonas TaxID=286 RepID=UPI000348BDBB|nr:hypothetical protein [Pseudomonas fluorescens]